jgi:hypothetical protein
MSTFKGTLVAAGMLAVAGLGCSHYREKTTTVPATPPSSTEVTTPPSAQPLSPAVEPGRPGTEEGRGGSGQDTAGFPQSTPSTTTPRQSSTGEPLRDHQDQPIQNDTSIQNDVNMGAQPGVGGSGDVNRPGMDVKNPDMNPEACNRNQIGSPNSSDVICPPDQNMGTGGSGLDPSKDVNPSSSDLSPSSSSGESTSGTSSGTSSDLKSSTGIGGAGLDQGSTSTTTTETKKTVKHKKHKKSDKDKDTSGTGGSGLHDVNKDTSSDQSSSSDQDVDKVP